MGMRDIFNAADSVDSKNKAAAEKQSSEDLEFHTDMKVGEILRRTRNHYGQSLQQIEQVIRIRATNLDAIEKGEIQKLPGRVYAIGFVRAYSEYLGLDGDKMVHLFKDQSVGREVKTDLSFPVPAEESKAPNLYIVGGSILALILFIIALSFFIFPNQQQNDIPPVPEELSKSTLNEAPALIEPVQNTVVAEQSPAPEPAKPTNRIVLEISEPSWVEIKDKSGAAILRQVLKPGDMYLVPPEEGLVMSTGNAGGIVMTVDGKKIGALGDAGEIKRKVLLSPEMLLKGQ
jgi:cytoskeleton protein RodZ